MTQTSSRGLKFFILAVLLALGGGLFLMLGPPQLLAKTESPEFCASCHIHGVALRGLVPPGRAPAQGLRGLPPAQQSNMPPPPPPPPPPPAHYAWKSIDGMKDLFLFHSGQVPERHPSSPSTASKVVQANCVRCHEDRRCP